MQFFGHAVSCDGIKTNPEEIEKIRSHLIIAIAAFHGVTGTINGLNSSDLDTVTELI